MKTILTLATFRRKMAEPQIGGPPRKTADRPPLWQVVADLQFGSGIEGAG
jgi:hypothetical protein